MVERSGGETGTLEKAEGRENGVGAWGRRRRVDGVGRRGPKPAEIPTQGKGATMATEDGGGKNGGQAGWAGEMRWGM